MTVLDTDPRSGYFTLIHHNIPIEYSWDIDERLTAIDHRKPKHELAERKRYIVYVPESKIAAKIAALGVAFYEEWEALDKEWKDLNKKWEDFSKKWEALDKERVALYAEWVALYEERFALNKGWKDLYKKWEALRPQLTALMLEIVPDAPWDKEKGCLVVRRKGR